MNVPFGTVDEVGCKWAFAVKLEVVRPGLRAVVVTDGRKEQMDVRHMVDTELKLPALNAPPCSNI